MANLELAPERCRNCFKAPDLCFCQQIQPLRTKTKVLILQHPQEKKEPLSTGYLAHLAIQDSVLKVGLSWPNLVRQLSEKPNEWGVLYLGSGIKKEKHTPKLSGLVRVDRNGKVLDEGPPIRGLVLLDGTWSQAKALWWRNAWLLKLSRLILIPTRPSLYGNLRKEPRKECLSTIESLGAALTALQEPPAVEQALLGYLAELLARYRNQKK